MFLYAHSAELFLTKKSLLTTHRFADKINKNIQDMETAWNQSPLRQ